MCPLRTSHFDSPIMIIVVFLCLNETALSLNEISHKIDEDVHDSSKVSDNSCWCEEKTIGHDLQVELDAHKDHKHILPDLKQKEGVPESDHTSARLFVLPLIRFCLNTCSVGTCMTLVKGDSNIMEMQEQMVTTIITQSK